MLWPADDDFALRTAASDWLRVRTNDGLDALSSQEINDFTFRGAPFRLMDAQRGIRKPAVLSAALSIRTTYRPEGAARPYDDDLGPDGLVRYKWRRPGPPGEPCASRGHAPACAAHLVLGRRDGSLQTGIPHLPHR